jgi:hypothetical protein
MDTSTKSKHRFTTAERSERSAGAEYSLVPRTGRDVSAEGQGARQQAVEDHPRAPHVHLAAVVPARLCVGAE